ncbi:hypothetical protein TNCV_399171 [Trichonephila clavipes]|uniref:Uncharacterized protein n=1 Tax=Trichonephila clavipes TaxID=2585209 RepID=A0A8X7B7L3_TRICX|nr:hypothetical protein TNCV_399171 [Trichonephila clavipes]
MPVKKAYGAAAFLRVKHKDRVSVDLVTSKEPCCTSEKVQAIDGNPLFRTGFAKSNPSPILTRGSTVPARTTQQIYLRGISVDALTTNSKWWNGSSFLRQIDFQTKGLDEAIPERVYLTEMRKNSNPKRGHFLDIDSD